MSAEQLVRALAVAWSTKQLYPNPVEVEAFTEAVDRLGVVASDAMVLAIGVDGFEFQGEAIDVNQAAADRLAATLFGLNVGTIAITGRPQPSEVLAFLELVESVTEDPVEYLPDALTAAGVASIRVTTRDLLEDSLEDEVNTDLPEAESILSQLLDDKDAAQAIAREIESASDGSPHDGAQDLAARFAASWEHCDRDDWIGREKVVQGYVDVFMALPQSYQVEFLSVALENRHQRLFANFLDQFASSELAEIAPQLDSSSLELLLDYARVVSEEESHRTDLLDLMTTSADVGRARGGIVGIVGQRLSAVSAFEQSQGDTAAAVRDALADEVDADRHGMLVAEAMFDIEQRGHRRVRFGKVWCAKVTEMIKQEQFDDAINWLEALENASGVESVEVSSLYAGIANDEVLRVVTAVSDDPRRVELLEWFASRAGRQIVEAMGEEEDAGRRRMLIDVVAKIASVDLKSVVPGLKDPRWFVVRNVVLALGKSKRSAAVKPLGPLVHHPDHRVRIETLRSLVLCGGAESVRYLVKALRDEHVRVRSSAVDLLGAMSAPEAQAALCRAAKDESLPTEERVDVIKALAEVRSEEGIAVLKSLARGRGGLIGSGRTIRTAAREVLGKRR